MSTPRIGADVGGTKILIGAIGTEGDVVERARIATPTGAEALCRAVADAVTSLSSFAGQPIGLAMAGRIDPDQRTVRQAANLGLVNVPLAELLEQRTQVAVRLVNDADAALGAECAFGVARGCADALMVAVGTGVGGSVAVRGQLVPGAHGGAGEIGHMVVKLGGRACACGGSGCLDQYGSGRALWRYAKRANRNRTALPSDLGAAANAGVPYALEAYDRVGRWLGVGIANAVALLDPSRIVLAGGVAASTPILLQTVQRHLFQELRARGVRAAPELALAELGANAGMIGAALLSVETATSLGTGNAGSRG